MDIGIVGRDSNSRKGEIEALDACQRAAPFVKLGMAVCKPEHCAAMMVNRRKINPGSLLRTEEGGIVDVIRMPPEPYNRATNLSSWNSQAVLVLLVCWG